MIDEKVRWQSAEQLVSLFTSWWDTASRLEGIDAERRDKFIEDAIATVRRAYPGAFETTGKNHVLFAIA